MTLALVTGATGFIGQHLVHRLVRSGVAVRALVRERRDRGPHRPRLDPPLDAPEVDVAWGDVTDADAVAG
ncbi:MAG: NAD-dependent epimerase/dehydratase family protein, partial [Gemmatimonadota bacterium]